MLCAVNIIISASFGLPAEVAGCHSQINIAILLPCPQYFPGSPSRIGLNPGRWLSGLITRDLAREICQNYPDSQD